MSMIASARVRTVQANASYGQTGYSIRRQSSSAAGGTTGSRSMTWQSTRRSAKGTVYLHWKTREELFYAVILRANLGAIEEFIAAVRADPREALLHRMVRLKYLSAMRRPILRAVVSADLTVLGRLASSGDSDLASLQTLVSTDYFQGPDREQRGAARVIRGGSDVRCRRDHRRILHG